MLVWRMSLQRDLRICSRSGACPNPFLLVRFEDDDWLDSVRAKDRAESVEWMREPTVVGWTVLQLGPAFLLFCALAPTSISAGLRWKLCRKCSTSFRSRNQSPSTVAEVRVGHHGRSAWERPRSHPFANSSDSTLGSRLQVVSAIRLDVCDPRSLRQRSKHSPKLCSCQSGRRSSGRAVC